MANESQAISAVDPELNGVAEKTVDRLDAETPGPNIPDPIPAVTPPSVDDAASEGMSLAAKLADLLDTVEKQGGVLTELTSRLTAAPADVVDDAVDDVAHVAEETTETLSVPWTHRGFGKRI